MKRLFCLVGVLSLFLFLPVPVVATHSWNGYHWARTANPFTLKLGDNTSGNWSGMLAVTAGDWSLSNILDTAVVPGGSKPKSCRPTLGRDEVCSANYGNTGWLGLAQIWITGGTHIYQGAVKNNDYYFGSSIYKYNNTAEQQHVICQEIGHTLGLDHQSTNGDSLNTCMDYYHNTSASDTKSTRPNQHDYDELDVIYAHLDAITTLGQTTKNLPAVATEDLNDPREWGKLIRSDVRESVYERDLGRGHKLLTFVTWVR